MDFECYDCGAEADYECDGCGKDLCQNCLVQEDGDTYCESCGDQDGGG